MSKLIRKSSKGFTLIELMIVVAIIGILAAIAIPNFLRFQLKSKSSEGKVNVAAIRTAEESYNAEFGRYVAAAGSPALTAVTSSKVVFADTGGTTTSSFSELGWAPEGNVFFSYAVSTATSPSLYSISASADIDGNGTDQSWGYIKALGTGTGIAAPVAACGATGTGAGTNQTNTVGPCQPGHGTSIF